MLVAERGYRGCGGMSVIGTAWSAASKIEEVAFDVEVNTGAPIRPPDRAHARLES